MIVFARNATTEQSELWTPCGYQCWPCQWGSWVRPSDKDGWGRPDKSIGNWQVCWSGVPIFSTQEEAREYAWNNGGKVRPHGGYKVFDKQGWEKLYSNKEQR